jgi:hypothetical protein
MKVIVTMIALPGVTMICHAEILTSDALTQLPRDPASNSRLNLGNTPTAMQPTTICQSKFQANLYTMYETLDETTAWYTAHLQGLKHAHGYSSRRSRESFYNPDGHNVDTHTVMYYRFSTGLGGKDHSRHVE